MITLRGMTWAHTRGFVPMAATAQRYQELHPGVEIVWEKRSLRDFEEFPVEELAARYDLLVIDHPFVGFAARHRVLQPLDELLPPGFAAEQAAHAVGASHKSYLWDNQLWALAIDAATPVAAWRPDLLEEAKVAPPCLWSEVIALARFGLVEIPAAPINCLMNFFGLCASLGEAPFRGPDQVVGREVGREALARLRELVAACDPGCLARNPIQSLDLLASEHNHHLAYCLFPYGYSNYAQEGYAARALRFGDLPALGPGLPPLTTTLGGTGLALSGRSAHARVAADYAQFVAGPEVQRTLYARCGGQPGHRSAWIDAENNRRADGYFTATLPALDRAFLRPRHAGYLHGFQKPGGFVVHRMVRGEAGADETLAALDQLWIASLAA